jgi:glycosyltransferase involved in cell wall biosynthesis
MSLKVLIVSDSYPPLQGGGTRATHQLAQHLYGRGHSVAVATVWQHAMPAYELDGKVPVHRLRGAVSRAPALSADPVRYTPPPFPDPELSLRLARLIAHYRPDLVHAYGWITYSCRVALRDNHVPLLVCLRDYGNVCAVRTMLRQTEDGVEACSGPAWGKCLSCASRTYGPVKGAVSVASVLGQRRTLCRRLDGVHSVSTFVEKIATEFLLGDRDVTRRVIPDYRDDNGAAELPGSIAARLPPQPYILFVGAFRRNKGDQVCIDAYDRLTDPPPLVMAGNRGQEDLPVSAKDPGMRMITQLVDVPHRAIAGLWDRALFGVCPSVAPEALGNTIHEGMSRGKAVIGTRPGGHSDMIDDGESGLLVPSGDVPALAAAMNGLLADPDARVRLGEAARTRAGAFRHDVVTPQLDALIAEVASRGR